MTDGRKNTEADGNAAKLRNSKIFLDMHLFDRLTRERGWDNDIKRAKEIGVDPSTLSRLRAKKIGAGVDLVFDLPQLLNVPTHVLFFREEQWTSSKPSTRSKRPPRSSG